MFQGSLQEREHGHCWHKCPAVSNAWAQFPCLKCAQVLQYSAPTYSERAYECRSIEEVYNQGLRHGDPALTIVVGCAKSKTSSGFTRSNNFCSPQNSSCSMYPLKSCNWFRNVRGSLPLKKKYTGDFFFFFFPSALCEELLSKNVNYLTRVYMLSQTQRKVQGPPQ